MFTDKLRHRTSQGISVLQLKEEHECTYPHYQQLLRTLNIVVAHGSTDSRLTWIQQFPVLSCARLWPLDWSSQQEVRAKPLDCMLCCLQSRAGRRISNTSFKSSLFNLPDLGILFCSCAQAKPPQWNRNNVRSRPQRTTNRSAEFITVSARVRSLNRVAKAFAPSHANSGMHLPGGKQNISIASQGEQEQEKPKHSAAQLTKWMLGEAVSVSEVLLLLPVATHCLNFLPSHPMTAHGCDGREQSRVSSSVPAGRVDWRAPDGKYKLYLSNRTVRQRCFGSIKACFL